MTVELAQVTNRVQNGPYGEFRLTDEQIRELKYAALLHDFGKVGVKEKVLQKGRKLLSGELRLVRERFNTIRRTIETEHLRQMLDCLLRSGDPSHQELERLRRRLEKELAEIDKAWEDVKSANQPTVTFLSGFERIEEIARRGYTGLDGKQHQFLEKGELMALKIPLGTLTAEERTQIEEHVDHTFEFLSKIPWTRDLQNIPRLARAHHLKLDGSGYPRKLQGVEIAPQTRMMTISDIFDALAAQDRPYKPRMPDPLALDILKEDAREGKLDADLLDLFIEAKVFEKNS
jgi:response regulator RpfG family c-di-GMP phosphodiesterase